MYAVKIACYTDLRQEDHASGTPNGYQDKVRLDKEDCKSLGRKDWGDLCPNLWANPYDFTNYIGRQGTKTVPHVQSHRELINK